MYDIETARGGLVGVRAETAPHHGDVKEVLDDLNKTFAEFKDENDKVLADLKKGQEDVVQKEKVDRINDHVSKLEQQVDDITAKFASTQLHSGQEGEKEDPQYAVDYEAFVRTGQDDRLRAHHQGQEVYNSMSVGTDADGGYTAPVEWDRKISDALVDISPVRKICNVMSVGKRGYEHLYNLHGTTAGWVGETDPRPETDTSTFAKVAYNTQELYAMPAATKQLLDDSEIDIASWMASEVLLAFAKEEGLALLNGDGTGGKPKGLMQYGSASSHPLGDVETIASGDAASLTTDGLVDLVTAIPEEYENNAQFIMNKKTVSDVRKLKDSDGNYIWQPALSQKEPSTLLGFGYTRMKGLPNVAGSAVPIAFGDFKEAYTILDRQGVQILRDPYTSKPYVLFYTTKRVGGFMKRPDAIKYHAIAA